MTEPTACARGCTTRGKHAGCVNPETCPGCQPSPALDGSLLCGACDAALHQLIASDGHEGLAWILLWLSTNLGQYLRHVSTLGGSGCSDSKADHLVAVACVMGEIQIAICETAEDFASSCGATPPGRGEGHLEALAFLRRWIGTLARWEVVPDLLDELLDLRDQAHAVAPWRELHSPDADEYAASQIYLAPPEPTDVVCQRFGIPPSRLWKARQRRKVSPVDEAEKPLRWRPWDVFTWLHPKEAEYYCGRLAS